jgi:hypothetical protein
MPYRFAKDASAPLKKIAKDIRDYHADEVKYRVLLKIRPTMVTVETVGYPPVNQLLEYSLDKSTGKVSVRHFEEDEETGEMVEIPWKEVRFLGVFDEAITEVLEAHVVKRGKTAKKTNAKARRGMTRRN